MQTKEHGVKDCYDVHLLSKALNILSKFYCKTWRQSKLLYFSGILMTIKHIMSYTEMATTREAAILVTLIIRNPDDMLCWLKFANNRLTVNSACTMDHLVKLG